MELAGIPVRRIGERLFEGIDGTLLLLLITLSMLGMAALFSATFESPSGSSPRCRRRP
jgi:hypothetical protein